MDKVSKILKEQVLDNLLEMIIKINKIQIFLIHRKIKMVNLKISIMQNQEIRAIKKKIKQKILDII